MYACLTPIRACTHIFTCAIWDQCWSRNLAVYLQTDGGSVINHRLWQIPQSLMQVHEYHTEKKERMRHLGAANLLQISEEVRQGGQEQKVEKVGFSTGSHFWKSSSKGKGQWQICSLTNCLNLLDGHTFIIVIKFKCTKDGTVIIYIMI